MLQLDWQLLGLRNLLPITALWKIWNEKKTLSWIRKKKNKFELIYIFRWNVIIYLRIESRWDVKQRVYFSWSHSRAQNVQSRSAGLENILCIIVKTDNRSNDVPFFIHRDKKDFWAKLFLFFRKINNFHWSRPFLTYFYNNQFLVSNKKFFNTWICNIKLFKKQNKKKI